MRTPKIWKKLRRNFLAGEDKVSLCLGISVCSIPDFICLFYSLQTIPADK